MDNYYEAHLSSDTESTLSVLTLSLDSLEIDQRIALIKIDAEGHEAFVLKGMQKLIKKHFPILIVETRNEELISSVASLGYDYERLKNSPNILFKPQNSKK